MSITSIWRERPIIGGRWTLKDVVQGKPLNHPSHAMFVHFPSALFPAALIFDIISLISPDITLARAAFYNAAVGLAAAGLAAITGLVDYLPMVGGSRKKVLGTYHLVAQVANVSLMAASLAVRATDYDAEHAPALAIVLAAGAVSSLVIGNWFGGYLVYRQGMRVSTEF